MTEAEKMLFSAKTAEETKAALAAGADVNAKPYGRTALDIAVSRGQNIERIKTLIAAGADVNARDKEGRTTLMKAQTAEQTKLLIDAGADVNAKDVDGFTALMKAKTAEQTKLLIDAGADVNAKDVDGFTALVHAETAEQTKLLIDAGADVNAKDEDGRTALYWAPSEKLQLLIAAGADVNAKDEDGRTALLFGIERISNIRIRNDDDIKRLEVLINAGADVNAKDEDGETPLMFIAKHFHGEHPEELETFGKLAKMLVRAGAKKKDALAYLDKKQPDTSIESQIPKFIKSFRTLMEIIESTEPNPNFLKNIETKKRLQSASRSLKGRKSGVVFADAIANMIRSGKIKGDVTPEMAKKLRTQWMKDMASNGKK